jgi:rhamnose utilization protein RhaD (predicted bifunctional aldolase and dehydrogenase)
MKHRFDTRKASRLAGVELLTYLSRVVGEDEMLVQHGGGNSSCKTKSADCFGHTVDVIHIKGSGSDMKTISPKDFVTLRLKEARSLRGLDLKSDADMMDFMDRCLLDPAVIRSGGPRPSVETPLHVLVDAPWVLHTHDYATEALTDTTRGPEIIEDLYGGDLTFVPYARPGLPLAKSIPAIDSRGSKGLVLSNHGIVVWGDTAEECYENLHFAINKAEKFIAGRGKSKRVSPVKKGVQGREKKARQLMPTLRGELSRLGGSLVILTYSDDQAVHDFLGSRKLSQVVI